MEAIKLCRLDTPIIFIEARINLSRFVVTGCAAKTSATVTFPSLNLISLFAFCFNIWLNGVASRSEERFSRNAETDLVCRLLLEKKKGAKRQKTTPRLGLPNRGLGVGLRHKPFPHIMLEGCAVVWCEIIGEKCT